MEGKPLDPITINFLQDLAALTCRHVEHFGESVLSSGMAEFGDVFKEFDPGWSRPAYLRSLELLDEAGPSIGKTRTIFADGVGAQKGNSNEYDDESEAFPANDRERDPRGIPNTNPGIFSPPPLQSLRKNRQGS